MFSTEVKFWTQDPTELQLVAQCQQVIEQYREDNLRRQAAEASAQAVLQQAARVDNVRPALVVTESPELSPTKNEQANAPQASAVTEKEAIAALRAMMDAKGLPAVRALLDKFGVTRVGELSPENRAAFITEATQAAQAAGAKA